MEYMCSGNGELSGTLGSFRKNMRWLHLQYEVLSLHHTGNQPRGPSILSMMRQLGQGLKASHSFPPDFPNSVGE